MKQRDMHTILQFNRHRLIGAFHQKPKSRLASVLDSYGKIAAVGAEITSPGADCVTMLPVIKNSEWLSPNELHCER